MTSKMKEQKSDYDFNPMPPSRFNNGRYSYQQINNSSQSSFF